MKLKWPRGRNGIVAGIVAAIFVSCCCLMAFAAFTSSTPSGKATGTARAAARQTDEATRKTPKPSNTPRPSNTPHPSNTLRPSATLRPPTATRASTNTGLAPTITRTRAPAFTATQSVPQPTQPPQATATQAPPPFAVINITSPVSAGSNANVVIQTSAGVGCYLSYTTPSGTVSQAQGLGATTADGSGICSWTWLISSSTNPGTGSLAISANNVTQYYPIVIQ